MGRSLVAYNVRFNKKAASEALTESLVSFLEPPVPPPATLRGDPFLELPMKLTTAAFRDSATTALRARQKRARGRHKRQTVARLRCQQSGTCCSLHPLAVNVTIIVKPDRTTITSSSQTVSVAFTRWCGHARRR